MKLVSNSTIPLKYKFTLTASEETGNIGNLSLAGCQSKKSPEGVDVALTESDLITANPTPDSYSPQEVVFDVPAATENNSPVTVYAVLKLTCSPTDLTTTYNFSLRLEIIQGQEGAGVTESNSPATNTELTMEIGNAPSTPDTTATTSDAISGSDKVTQQPSDENNSGGNHTETPSGSTTETPPSSTGETGTPSGASDTGTTSGTSDTDTSGGNGDAGSEPEPAPAPST